MPKLLEHLAMLLCIDVYLQRALVGVSERHNTWLCLVLIVITAHVAVLKSLFR